MINREATLFLVFGVLLHSFVAAQARPSNRRGSALATFNLAEPFTRPAKLPAAVLRLLRQQIIREQWCEFEEPDGRVGLASWFSATRVDLNRDHVPDYIVRSHKPCLSGADNAWFWIFRSKGRGYELVLFGGAETVSVLKRRVHGLRVIKTGWHAARTYYTFNGRAYVSRRG